MGMDRKDGGAVAGPAVRESIYETTIRRYRLA